VDAQEVAPETSGGAAVVEMSGCDLYLLFLIDVFRLASKQNDDLRRAICEAFGKKRRDCILQRLEIDTQIMRNALNENLR
jgi:hypothetical protein